jgi:hypothetical protein|tara:strand:- start:322 stop:456 length:135 start_codon:yes stop_codon:yes gene_type:complete
MDLVYASNPMLVLICLTAPPFSLSKALLKALVAEIEHTALLQAV